MASKENNVLSQWRANFFTGLVILLPAVVSVWLVVVLFTHIFTLTNYWLLLLPDNWAHETKHGGGKGDIYWYWPWIALLLTLFLICLVGRYGRYYLGSKAIELMDRGLMHVPLLNKIYGTIKQVNQSFSSNKSSFKQVVLVPFPHARSRSIAFVTGEQHGLGAEKLISVFIPTTPNPTSGFLLLVPESEVVKLDISVADGIKFIISLGAISPDYAGHSISALPAETNLK